jgi:hypothetical protein
MTEIDTQTPVPLAPSANAETQDTELHLEEQGEQPGEVAEHVEEPEKPEEQPVWNKALQQEQQKRANLEKRFDSIESLLKDIAKGSAKPQQQADDLADLESLLTSEKGKDWDLVAPGISDVMKRLAAVAREGRNSTASQEVRELRQELEFERFFAKYPESYKTAYEAEQEKRQEQGFAGDKLQGAMTVWFETYVENQKSAKKETGNTPRAASGSGNGRVIPSSTGPRKTTAPDAKRQLQSGRGGNIGGVPFRP